ncbi:MAG: hypothetical protein WCO67_11185 [Betaproteobacteria bacterium]
MNTERSLSGMSRGVAMVVVSCVVSTAWPKPPVVEPMKVNCGATHLYVVTEQQYEDSVVHIRILGGRDRDVFPTITWPGVFIPLCSRSVFVLLDTSVHYRPRSSFVMGADASVISSFNFGAISSFGASDDEKLFWVQSLEGVEHPVTILQVVDYMGVLVHKEVFVRETVASVRFENKEYAIAILKPEPPG